jgi:hypothetical protein
MPGGCARPIAPYSLIERPAKSRGQRRGIVRVDGRTREGILLKKTRKALLDFLGPNITPPQRAICERIAWLELRCAVFDAKQIDGTFTHYDSATHLALIGGLRRLYREIGFNSPAPKFADLMKAGPRPRGRPRKAEQQ